MNLQNERHQQGPHGIPEFIELLSVEDKQLYEKLQNNVGSPNYRYNRNHRIDTLKDLFSNIRDFCEHDNEEDERWKRYLVCGICWFKDYIAINTKQLRLLISKSKSTINGALAKMGYQTVSLKGEQASLLLEKIPYLFGHYKEFRKWSIRKIKSNDTENIRKRKSRRNEIINQRNINIVNNINNNICCNSDNDKNDDDKFYDDLFKDLDWSDDCDNKSDEKELNFLNYDNNFDDRFDNDDFDFEFDPRICQNFLNSRKEIEEVDSNNNFKFEECTIIC